MTTTYLELPKFTTIQHVENFWKKVRNDYQVDHVVALSRGGCNGVENLVISCPTCNRKKNAKTPWEFAGRLF